MSKIKKEFLKEEKTKIIKIIIDTNFKEEVKYMNKSAFKEPFFRSSAILGLGDDNQIYVYGKEWNVKEKKFKNRWILF